jgi:hypothetical protein
MATLAGEPAFPNPSSASNGFVEGTGDRPASLTLARPVFT